MTSRKTCFVRQDAGEKPLPLHECLKAPSGARILVCSIGSSARPAAANDMPAAFAWRVLIAAVCLKLALTFCEMCEASGTADHPVFTDHLLHFEMLDAADVKGHSIKKRSLHKWEDEVGGIVQVKFDAFGRHFHLYLTKDTSVFSSGFEVFTCNRSGRTEALRGSFTDEIYSGHVADDVSSRVVARWDNGVLVAKLETSQDVFYLEPLFRLIPHADNQKIVVYRRSDLLWTTQTSVLGNRMLCASKDGDGHSNVAVSQEKNYTVKTEAHPRKKRSIAARNTCGLLVIADYLFFRDVAGSSETIAGNYMIDIVSRVDKLYRSTQFSKTYKNMGFSIKEILIHTEWSEDYYHYNAHRNWTADELLNALGNYSAHGRHLNNYCLVHLFTANAQLSGVLGYANIAEKSFYTGICSQRTQPPEGNPGFMFNNTSFSTLFFGSSSRLLASQAELLLAHELGHNWGSKHDPMTVECFPLVNGTYLMSEYTQDHREPNNEHFSSCSTRQISSLLEQCAGYSFEVARDAQRGNYRIDEGEECDEGVTGGRCCSSDFRLRFGPTSCSERNSECCTNCSAFAANGTVCRYSSDMHCLAEATCDGVHTSCPLLYKSVGTQCLASGLGRCQPRLAVDASHEEIYCASVCEVIGLRSCMCKDEASRCRLCCRVPTDSANSTCKELTYLEYLARIEECGSDKKLHCRINRTTGFEPYLWTDVMQLPVDTPCVVGYCDTEGVCKKQTRDKITEKTLMSGFTVDKAVKFMKDNIVGTVVVSSLLLCLPFVLLVSYLDSKWYRQQQSDVVDFGGSLIFEASQSLSSIPEEMHRYSTSCAYLPVPVTPPCSEKEMLPFKQHRTLPPVLRLLSHDQYSFAPGLMRQASRDRPSTQRYAPRSTKS